MNPTRITGASAAQCWALGLLAASLIAAMKPTLAWAGPDSLPDSVSAQSPPPGPSKRLIEFGWDEPDTAFLREHIAEMEASPFDGCVFHVTYPKAERNFTWEAWGTRAFTASELEPALNDLKATHFARFKSNFLRFNTTPAKLDWFDDYAAVTNNARLAAWLAREGRCAGVLFDIEQYEGALFDYSKQRDKAAKSWEVYAAQARTRGAQVMRAFQQGYPDLTVFLTFGYSLPWAESHSGRKALAECHYGLLAPFLDGMVRAAAGHTRLVDGYELSYGFKDVARFAPAYQSMKTELLPIVADPDRYARVFDFAFGIWMDQDWRKHGWDTNNLSKNFYSPEALEATVRQALATADQYVWIYTEKPRWWSKEGGPVDLPPTYREAIRRARQ